jgi:hypothetical protein
MTITIPPWQNAALHADPGQISKRQKKEWWVLSRDTCLSHARNKKPFFSQLVH